MCFVVLYTCTGAPSGHLQSSNFYLASCSHLTDEHTEVFVCPSQLTACSTLSNVPGGRFYGIHPWHCSGRQLNSVYSNVPGGRLYTYTALISGTALAACSSLSSVPGGRFYTYTATAFISGTALAACSTLSNVPGGRFYTYTATAFISGTALAACSTLSNVTGGRFYTYTATAFISGTALAACSSLSSVPGGRLYSIHQQHCSGRLLNSVYNVPGGRRPIQHSSVALLWHIFISNVVQYLNNYNKHTCKAIIFCICTFFYK
jgi:hypothetical protein